jgi:hypothetical protein
VSSVVCPPPGISPLAMKDEPKLLAKWGENRGENKPVDLMGGGT